MKSLDWSFLHCINFEWPNDESSRAQYCLSVRAFETYLFCLRTVKTLSEDQNFRTSKQLGYTTNHLVECSECSRTRCTLHGNLQRTAKSRATTSSSSVLLASRELMPSRIDIRGNSLTNLLFAAEAKNVGETTASKGPTQAYFCRQNIWRRAEEDWRSKCPNRLQKRW